MKFFLYFALVVTVIAVESLSKREDSLLNSSPVLREDCICGRQPSSRIVGGEVTEENEYPWMVALCYDRKCDGSNIFCGGSLINDQYVLTAAHCLDGMIASNIYLSLGDYNLKIAGETNSVDRQAAKLIINSFYDPDTERNDIALIRLNEPVEVTDTLLPVCLPPANKTYAGKVATVTGWGVTRNGAVLTPYVLREVNVTVLTNKFCTERKGYNAGDITAKMMCAQDKDKDSCQGDSGGPLVIKDGAFYDQIGIVSFGYRCADYRFPGVYTRVNSYLKWIEANADNATWCTDLRPTTTF